MTVVLETCSQQLREWLSHLPGLFINQIEAMTPDAGFRRYYRVYSQQRTFVAMDASLAQENLPAFIAIAESLAAHHVHTPQILQRDMQQGYLLLSDFGDTTYLQALTPANAESLYALALAALAKMQSCASIHNYIVPAFTPALMLQEWQWHQEWFMRQLLTIELPASLLAQLQATIQGLITSISQQPVLFMHRDYHSQNIMLLANKEPGVIDFQDAFIGPVTYDLVSLLRDCYIAWPEDDVLRWVIFYKQNLLYKTIATSISDDEFVHWFDEMGIQRHLKALFTFARKAVRDHDHHYLVHVPRTVNYISAAAKRHPQLQSVVSYMADFVLPGLEKAKLL
jgi:aminoglycoside/choline kinase family phosphotransferase